MKFTKYIEENKLDNVENVNKLTLDQRLRDMSIMKIIIDNHFFKTQLETNKSLVDFQNKVQNFLTKNKDNEEIKDDNLEHFLVSNKEQIEQTERMNGLFEKKIKATEYLIDRYEKGNLSKDVLVSMFYLGLTSYELDSIDNAGTYINMFLKVKQIENQVETD